MRHVTVDEANSLIPILAPVLEDLQGLASRLREAMRVIREFELRAAGNGHGENSPVFEPRYDIEKIQPEIAERLRYLEGLGVHLKDIESGILDFPTRMFGRDVYLCWRLGEERISFWHDIDSGFAGRQPL